MTPAEDLLALLHSARPDLEQGAGHALLAALPAARAAWPDVHVDPARLVAFLAPKLGEPADPLAGLDLADLYLACACDDGDPAALVAFDRVFTPQLDRAVDQLAVLHRVHRATTARWIAAARKAVLDGTRRASPAACACAPPSSTASSACSTASSTSASPASSAMPPPDSILRLFDSQLDVSLPGLLRDAPT